MCHKRRALIAAIAGGRFNSEATRTSLSNKRAPSNIHKTTHPTIAGRPSAASIQMHPIDLLRIL